MGAPLAALSTARIDQVADGTSVALLFADGDPTRPLIIGLIHNPLEAILEEAELEPATGDTDELDAHVDGERLVFEADKEIVLRCGNASIILTRAGKILIRGAYLASRSSGVNQIMGGSVQIN